MEWPPGAATGVGSLPGEDPAEAARLVVGELPDFVHLPELPARGPGADLIGRTAALLVDMPVDLQPAGWRLVDHPGRDQRRGMSYLSADLDAFEEAAQGYSGLLKVQVAGPWTLAAGMELPRGNRVLRDAGAVRDLTASLAEAVAQHLADLRRRAPGGSLVLQLDEPSLPAVLDGRIPTASGLGTHPAVTEAEAEDALRTVFAVAGDTIPVVHCCAPRPPIALLCRAGARALSFDLRLADDDNAVGEAIEGGVRVLAGVVPATDAAAAALGAELSAPPATVRDQLVRLAVAALAACRETGRRLREAPEGGGEEGRYDEERGRVDRHEESRA